MEMMLEYIGCNDVSNIDTPDDVTIVEYVDKHDSDKTQRYLDFIKNGLIVISIRIDSRIVYLNTFIDSYYIKNASGEWEYKYPSYIFNI